MRWTPCGLAAGAVLQCAPNGVCPKCGTVAKHRQCLGGVPRRQYCNAERGNAVPENRRSPMAFEDRYGLPLSTSSEAAAEAYRGGLDLMLSAWSGAASAVDTAIKGHRGTAPRASKAVWKSWR